VKRMEKTIQKQLPQRKKRNHHKKPRGCNLPTGGGKKSGPTSGTSSGDKNETSGGEKGNSGDDHQGKKKKPAGEKRGDKYKEKKDKEEDTWPHEKKQSLSKTKRGHKQSSRTSIGGGGGKKVKKTSTP